VQFVLGQFLSPKLNESDRMSVIFGPVPSRRLGRSLGIDVIPPKTCSYDCVYCESGPTTHLTVKRQAFVDPDQVIEDLLAYFRDFPDSADVLTFSSAGEPTLYEPLGELIRVIKRHFQLLPLVVLTNGSLLWDSRVREALFAADRVVPSLDAVTETVLRNLNRPHPNLDIEVILEGLKAFRKDYRGQFHLEIMLASGFNDHPDELKKMRPLIDLLHPDQIELNTVVRPPADPCCQGLSSAEMEAVREFFPSQRTQIIGRFKGFSGMERDLHIGQRVLDMVRRRPCTVEEMAASLGVTPEDLQTTLADLLAREQITHHLFGGLEYVCRKDESARH
jgi:wyosine [tRNA(Phe)-imidazoG37] synthetase (radical SAM superfamily)